MFFHSTYMPMMWMFTLLSSLITLFTILSMIYFFYLPLLLNNKLLLNTKNSSNWIWKW